MSETLEWRIEASVIDYLKSNVSPAPKGGFRHSASSQSTEQGPFVSIEATKEENDPLGSGWWLVGVEASYKRDNLDETEGTDKDAKAAANQWAEIEGALDSIEGSDLRVTGSHNVANGLTALTHLENEPEEEDGLSTRTRRFNVLCGLVSP